MALYDSVIRRSYDPPNPDLAYYWETVTDPATYPSDAPTILAGWAATPLEALDRIRAEMLNTDLQLHPRTIKVTDNTTHAHPKWHTNAGLGLWEQEQPAPPPDPTDDDRLIAAIAERRNDTAFMERWKPGDRFNFPDGFEVRAVREVYVTTVEGVSFGNLDMARAVKLLPKARPVRKGDEIKYGGIGPSRYLGALDGDKYAVDPLPDGPFKMVNDGNWTHADGAPIDWEASE